MLCKQQATAVYLHIDSFHRSANRAPVIAHATLLHALCSKAWVISVASLLPGTHEVQMIQQSVHPVGAAALTNSVLHIAPTPMALQSC